MERVDLSSQQEIASESLGTARHADGRFHSLETFPPVRASCRALFASVLTGNDVPAPSWQIPSQGYSKVPYYFEQKFVEDRRVFISQNGVDWVDLPAFPAEKAGSAAKITAWLTGDLSFVSSVPEEPPPPPPVPEGEAPPDPPEPVVVEVTEMERISWMFNEITAATRIVPKGYLIVNGANELVPNKGYSGLSFPVRRQPNGHAASGDASRPPAPGETARPAPQRLTPRPPRASASRRSSTRTSTTRARRSPRTFRVRCWFPWHLHPAAFAQTPLLSRRRGALTRCCEPPTPGMWAITYDEFSQTAFIRHLEWPGFSFFFSNETKDYGAFYVGSGVKNGDILFMI